jgi:hypothetical protein
MLLSGLSLLMLTHVDNRMHSFVTAEDRDFVIMVFIYIAIITTYWILRVRATRKRKRRNEQDKATITTELPTTDIIQNKNHKTGIEITETHEDSDTRDSETHDDAETQKDGVNAMIASIHVSTCVLYGTPDNAYVSGFFFLLLFRCLQKLHDAHQNPSKWSMLSNTVLFFDIAYTTGTFTFGIIPHFQNDTESVLYAAAQFVICDTITANYTSHQSDTKIVDGTPVKNEGPSASDQSTPVGVKPTPEKSAHDSTKPTAGVKEHSGPAKPLPIITPELLFPQPPQAAAAYLSTH